MSFFRKIAGSPANSKFILQGNTAFALGIIHAGYHAATGYPGTPSTEVIDKSLAFVQDKIIVDWSVNEAVAVGVAVGHVIAGHDVVVTMKIPGLFQAGDAITTMALNSAITSACVIYIATDYVPSSTQHVIDARYFLANSRLPILEPRNHQEMYEIAWTAADISKKFNTPVAVLASGILTHSEGMVTLRESRITEQKPVPENLKEWMLLPSIARANYNKATLERLPKVQLWSEASHLISETEGTDDFGVIVCGESDIIVREALSSVGLNPSIFSMAISYPIPKNRLKAFRKKIKGVLFLFEDGDTFLEERLRLEKIEITGKNELSGITDWTPGMMLEFMSDHVDINYKPKKKLLKIKPLIRPPSICPGCPYKAFGLAVQKLKKKGKIYASFGDIGCSTLLYFLNAIDTVLCMGASDSMRQGFVLSRPDMSTKTISVIGDATECHSGLDATRNAVFRNVAGVKVLLDNRITAMTGGQVAPSSPYNITGQPHKFNLKRAVEAEGQRTVVVDAYDLKEIEEELKRSLELAEQGEFTVIIIEGECIHEVENTKKIRSIEIDYEKCRNCGLCNICPGIVLDENKMPHYTNLCTNCGSGNPVCIQYCPAEAIVAVTKKDKQTTKALPQPEHVVSVNIDKETLPGSLRVAIRGIGGQGNLFFGKVLSEVAMRTPYSETYIVKGDTHGMAQLGGSVISTFSCGEVFSPVLAPDSVDVLVVMEVSEVLRPGFLELLKPGGTIIFNNFTALPVNAKSEDYPDIREIEKILSGYKIIKIDADKIACDLGDKFSRTANVVVIGLLSTITPFSNIPAEIWMSALMTLSPDDAAKSANQMAFKAGREA